jgi:DNA modification methylase
VADVIKDASARGDLVLDVFGGSGSTLMAAERTKRRAALIEIDPLYVDAAVRRWQASTGQEAVCVHSGATFAERETAVNAPDDEAALAPTDKGASQ